MKRSQTLFLAITAVLAAGVAAAAPADLPMAKHARIDANGDGAISRAEAAANPRLAERFDQLDKNRDGRIDASERPQHGMRGGRGGMAALDANKDGAIDRSEAAKLPRLAERFDELDKNRDGRIDASERPQHGTRGGHGGMAALDANKDGAIDRAEAAKLPRLAQRFDQLDANRDGRIDASERPQHGGMAKLDTDRDGRLSRAGAAGSKLAGRFDQLDANRDGYVDRAEAMEGYKRLRAARGGGAPR